MLVVVALVVVSLVLFAGAAINSNCRSFPSAKKLLENTV
jgi:hypothetical protein